MPSSPSLCVDASLIVSLLVEPGSPLQPLWQRWVEEGRELAAPTLVFFEVANALYQSEKHGRLSSIASDTLFAAASGLPLRLYRDSALHLHALRLARDFSLPACYDAHYLALAERLGGELWTCDRRLANAVAPRFPWVRLAPG
ncbi:MAG TPA: type II toxin-antitoxin system VapC family toxin [Thermoanaerobaculia bacterium]|nr:type II toxin-antitoxin system VapC family toxin [Thermoanaerobaculia bacterium]